MVMPSLSWIVKIFHDRILITLIFNFILMNFIKFSCTAALLATSSLLAAAAAPTVGWTGFYAGINGGYANAHNKVRTHVSTLRTLPLPIASPTLGASTSVTAGTFSLSPTYQDFIGGGQVGYLYSLNHFVLGVETDIQGITPGTKTSSAHQIVPIPRATTSKIESNLALTQDIDYLGTVRGRLGILATPSLLFAATGGYAYGGTRLDAELAQNYLGTANNLVKRFTSDVHSSSTRSGWTVGGTLEWRYQGQWSTKLEYLYYDLGSKTYNATPLVSMINGGPNAGDAFFVNAVSATSQFNGHVVRLGINNLFA